MNQFGFVIINKFGEMGSAAPKLLPRLLAGLLAAAMAAFVVWGLVIPTLGATAVFLLALAPVLMWSGILLGVAAVGVSLPIAAKHFRAGAEANREAMAGWDYQMGAAEMAHRIARQQAYQRQLNPGGPQRPAYAPVTRVKELGR